MVCIVETSTQPGMTALSLAPEQARYVGIEFDDFVSKLLHLAVREHAV